ncbi:MAG: hypothetical protein LBS19_10715 [Clostridiales bacterium]|jgi:pantothenate synthetase|nr:hypothetical protein [Clostridiales bacterium]
MENIIKELIAIELQAREIARNAQDTAASKREESKLRRQHAEASLFAERRRALKKLEEDGEAELNRRVEEIKARNRVQADRLRICFESKRREMAEEIFQRLSAALTKVR